MSYQSSINAAIGSIAGATIGLKKGLNKRAGGKAKENLKETIESKNTTSPEETTKTIQEMVNVNKSEPEISSYDIDDTEAEALNEIFGDNNATNNDEVDSIFEKNENEKDTSVDSPEKKRLNKIGVNLYNKAIQYTKDARESVEKYNQFEKDFKEYYKRQVIPTSESDKMRAKYDPTGEYDKKIHLQWSTAGDWYNMVRKDLINDYTEKNNKSKIFNEAIDIYNAKDEEDNNDND